jgi:hypothetical protein
VFVIGGGPYTGAPALSGLAALRTGADLAYVAAPETVAREIQGYSADLIVEPFEGDHLSTEHVNGLLKRAVDRDVLVLGPGLGDAPETRSAVHSLLSTFEGRVVADADALQVVPDAVLWWGGGQTGARLRCYRLAGLRAGALDHRAAAVRGRRLAHGAVDVLLSIPNASTLPQRHPFFASGTIFE